MSEQFAQDICVIRRQLEAAHKMKLAGMPFVVVPVFSTEEYNQAIEMARVNIDHDLMVHGELQIDDKPLLRKKCGGSTRYETNY